MPRPSAIEKVNGIDNAVMIAEKFTEIATFTDYRKIVIKLSQKFIKSPFIAKFNEYL